MEWTHGRGKGQCAYSDSRGAHRRPRVKWLRQGVAEDQPFDLIACHESVVSLRSIAPFKWRATVLDPVSGETRLEVPAGARSYVEDGVLQSHEWCGRLASLCRGIDLRSGEVHYELELGCWPESGSYEGFVFGRTLDSLEVYSREGPTSLPELAWRFRPDSDFYSRPASSVLTVGTYAIIVGRGIDWAWRFVVVDARTGRPQAEGKGKPICVDSNSMLGVASNPGERNYHAVAFDFSGAELWRVENCAPVALTPEYVLLSGPRTIDGKDVSLIWVHDRRDGSRVHEFGSPCSHSGVTVVGKNVIYSSELVVGNLCAIEIGSWAVLWTISLSELGSWWVSSLVPANNRLYGAAKGGSVFCLSEV